MFVTCPSIFWGALLALPAPPALAPADADGWHCAFVPCANTGVTMSIAAATRAAVKVRAFMAVSSVLLGDVVDRAAHCADAGADQRALARSVARAGTDGGACARSHCRTRSRTAAGKRHGEHGHPDRGRDQRLHDKILPTCTKLQAADH